MTNSIASIASFAGGVPLCASPSLRLDIDEPLQLASWPSPLTDDALFGPAGDFVRIVAPHTESDPAALYFQLLIAFGNLAGRNAHIRVEAARHYPNTNIALVGSTSKGRKGTSWGHVVEALGPLDPAWAETRIQDGLGSGEGLIWGVRDPIEKTESVKEKGRVVGSQQVVVDIGIADKRLLVACSEFASILRVAMREGNILSAVIRNAWDTGDLHILVKNSPAKATGAHISILGHITKQELLEHFRNTEAANGFGNRFLWVCCRRSKSLPDGGSVPARELMDLRGRLRRALVVSRQFTGISRDAGAAELWRARYATLSEGRPGLLGAVLGRAEAQVTRLSLIFALLDGSCVIKEVHLRAALAAWRYAEESAAFIFGASLGNPLADEILAQLRASSAGLTRTDIHKLFGNHRSLHQIDQALTLLHDADLGHRIVTQTRGRAAERWFAGPTPAKEAKDANEANTGNSLLSLPSLPSQAGLRSGTAAGIDESRLQITERSSNAGDDTEARSERAAIIAVEGRSPPYAAHAPGTQATVAGAADDPVRSVKEAL